MTVKTDIEIARAANKRPILEIGEKLGIGADDLLWHSLDPKRNTEREGALEKLIPTLNSNDRRRHGGGDLKAQNDRSRRLLVVDTPESLPKVDAVFGSGCCRRSWNNQLPRQNRRPTSRISNGPKQRLP